MIFLNVHTKSLLPKCFISAFFIAAIAVAGWLMFANVDELFNWLKPYKIGGDFTRRIILIACSVIYCLRVMIMLFCFFKRRLVWIEAITISIIMPSILLVFAYTGGNKTKSIDIIDIIGILLYLFGSYINTCSEYLRHIWKKNPENKGQIYTEGLFKYSMHVNYFGDVVLFTGFAMITHSITLFLIIFFMALNFIFILIPTLDDYLENKYGEEFREYARRTKKFIPGVY